MSKEEVQKVWTSDKSYYIVDPGPGTTHTYWTCAHKPVTKGTGIVTPQQKKQRWMDSLPDHDTDGWTPHGYRHSALQWLNDALYWTEVGDQPKIVANALARAGSTIVAWRKSLDDQGKRWNTNISHSPDPALWIGTCIRDLSHRDVVVADLRFVEGVLRELWRTSINNE